MHPTLILLGLVGATALSLSVVPRLQAESSSPPPLLAQDSSDEARIYLTADQAAESAEQGLLPPGTRSILNVQEKLSHGEFAWDEQGVPSGKVTVRVDLQRQMLSVFRDGHEIGTAVVLFGAKGKDTPLGTFPIMTMIRDHRSRTYSNAPMPFTLRLTADGVAIHGSNVRWGAATHGCIGVPNEFAERLFEQANLGDKVDIVSSAAPT